MKEVVSTLRSQPSSMVDFPSSQRSVWQRFVSWLRFRLEIPYGYEDERGFHYGIEPAPSSRAERTTDGTKVFTDRASDVIPSPCPVALPDIKVGDEETRPFIKG
jgi:hypothetical protein